MSPAELAELRGRAINGDQAALKQWLALPAKPVAAPKVEEPKVEEPELPVEPEQVEEPKQKKKK